MDGTDEHGDRAQQIRHCGWIAQLNSVQQKPPLPQYPAHSQPPLPSQLAVPEPQDVHEPPTQVSYSLHAD